MTSKSFIVGEIRHLVAQMIDAERICDVNAFCTQFLAEKRGIEGPDSDFYLVCADEFVRSNARGVIAKYAPKSSTAPQQAFEGFDHLQKAYPVVRDGRQVLVPVGLLSDDEIDGRVSELRSMSAGCLAHADELVAYKRLRDQRASA